MWRRLGQRVWVEELGVERPWLERGVGEGTVLVGVLGRSTSALMVVRGMAGF